MKTNDGFTGEDVVKVVQCLAERRILAWIQGGWAIDAIVGRQTREHDDLEINFNTQCEANAIPIFEQHGFVLTQDDRPTRVVLMHPDGREIDMHPIEFDASGVGRLWVTGREPFDFPVGSFTSGMIEGTSVPCLTAALLIEFHSGYEPKEKDLHNMRVLHEHLNEAEQ